MFYRSLNRERDDDEDGDDEDEMVDRLADRMFNDRLLGNEEGEAQALEAQPQQREYLFGLIRVRGQNTMDLCCFRNLSKGFVYMLAFVVIILICLILYAACS